MATKAPKTAKAVQARKTATSAAGKGRGRVSSTVRSAPPTRRAAAKSSPANASKKKPPSVPDITATLLALGTAARATVSQRYFKTGKGEYGEGDRFIGVAVPVLRRLAGGMRDAGLEVALPLLRSGWHEVRAVALILLVKAFAKGGEAERRAIFDAYLANTRHINSWDLVDLSAPHIVGAWLADRAPERKTVLTRLARSTSLWERRIAIIATQYFIRRGEYAETLRLAELLLRDREDLIHKAVGWMLREVGERAGLEPEERFLKRFYAEMPRTMLRYAIEKFPAALRQQYLRRPD